MNAFVSGGAGFIGSHVVERLLGKGAERVTVFDNFSSGTVSHIAASRLDKRLQIVTGDLKDVSAIRNAMEGCDTVFHLAANPDISKATTQPDIDFWEGTFLTQNVLEAMRLTGAHRIFYTSGSGVYGEMPSVAFSEDHGPCTPISTYGASKLASEALISAYCHMFGVRGHVFRFANVVGPRQTHGVGYDFVRRLRDDPTRLRVLGDGTQRKSYVHVEDVLNAVFLVAETATESFGVLNVASPDYITVHEIAELAVEVCGLDLPNVHLDFTGGDRGWKGDVPVVLFDCTKIHSLGWICSKNSRAALRDSMLAMIKELNDE